jgi:hypothetical protein
MRMTRRTRTNLILKTQSIEMMTQTMILMMMMMMMVVVVVVDIVISKL